MSSTTAYLLFAAVSIPLWWPALRLILAEVRDAARPLPENPPAPPPPVTPLPMVVPWSSPRTRLAALAAARRTASGRRWEGGFGRRSP